MSQIKKIMSLRRKVEWNIMKTTEELMVRGNALSTSLRSEDLKNQNYKVCKKKYLQKVSELKEMLNVLTNQIDTCEAIINKKNRFATPPENERTKEKEEA